ncbi:MAG: hypothetical protein ACKER6_01550 [Candidatus Hodgkinia cicadicola]
MCNTKVGATVIINRGSYKQNIGLIISLKDNYCIIRTTSQRIKVNTSNVRSLPVQAWC